MYFACGWRCGMSSINKVNLQFIVTAYRFFQIISDCTQQLYGTLVLPPHALQLKGVALVIVSWSLAFLALFY